MGIIVLTLAILPLMGVGGMQLFQAESPGPTADKLTPRVQETAKLLWGIYVAFTGLEFLLLWIHPSMDWFDALNHAFATMATGGFSTKNGSIGAFDSVYIDIIITIFMFLAASVLPCTFGYSREKSNHFLTIEKHDFMHLLQ